MGPGSLPPPGPQGTGLSGSLDAHPSPEPGLEMPVASTEPPLTSSPLYFDFFFFLNKMSPFRIDCAEVCLPSGQHIGATALPAEHPSNAAGLPLERSSERDSPGPGPKHLVFWALCTCP